MPKDTIYYRKRILTSILHVCRNVKITIAIHDVGLPVRPRNGCVLVPPSGDYNCDVKPEDKRQRNQIDERLAVQSDLLKCPAFGKISSSIKSVGTTHVVCKVIMTISIAS